MTIRVGLPGTLVEVIPETADTTTLRFRLNEPVRFLPGQYFNLRLPVEGRPWSVARTYSVASSPFPPSPVIDLTVRETSGGLVSPTLVRSTPVGSILELDGPFGTFTWDERDGGPLLLVAAGSGIVPLVAILRYQEARELSIPTSLLYSSRDRGHIIFGADLERMERLHPSLRVAHTLTMDATDHRAAYHRRVDRLMLEEVVPGEPAALLAYVCGPPVFVKDVETMLIQIGVVPSRVRVEQWEQPAAGQVS